VFYYNEIVGIDASQTRSGRPAGHLDPLPGTDRGMFIRQGFANCVFAGSQPSLTINLLVAMS
jgi:hypothetical protein